VLKTNRVLDVLASLQPINTKYSREADARDQRTRRVKLGRLVQVSSVQFNVLYAFKTLSPPDPRGTENVSRARWAYSIVFEGEIAEVCRR